ncbi:hypothetical protein L195_g018626, partial [Trifolium pratense]
MDDNIKHFQKKLTELELQAEHLLLARHQDCVIADQAELDFEAKKLQSTVKEKSYLISETGALADLISPVSSGKNLRQVSIMHYLYQSALLIRHAST